MTSPYTCISFYFDTIRQSRECLMPALIKESNQIGEFSKLENDELTVLLLSLDMQVGETANAILGRPDLQWQALYSDADPVIRLRMFCRDERVISELILCEYRRWCAYAEFHKRADHDWVMRQFYNSLRGGGFDINDKKFWFALDRRRRLIKNFNPDDKAELK